VHLRILLPIILDQPFRVLQKSHGEIEGSLKASEEILCRRESRFDRV
jgi:hypothetical protein